jgi:ubiquinone/menaquinone biosynthesis C-methylase UbiE
MMMAIPKNTLDSYNSKAKEWAKRMRAGKNTAHDYLEKPAMYKLLPELKNKEVLCLGCGTGEECHKFMDLGAKRVIGIDISEGMIQEAKSAYPEIEFIKGDMRHLEFPDNSFHFAYSSLALHYQKNWLPCLKEIHRVLKPNGLFLFSTHHPFRWGLELEIDKQKKSQSLSITQYKDGKTEIQGNYFKARKIDDTWFGDFQVTYYHQPLHTIFKYIKESGFILEDFQEPMPLPSIKKKEPVFWEINTRIPLFLILKLRK